MVTLITGLLSLGTQLLVDSAYDASQNNLSVLGSPCNVLR